MQNQDQQPPQLKSANIKVSAEHGVVCSFPNEFFGYFGWPTVALVDDDFLIVGASGLRNAHVCPFGRTVLCLSADGGRSWTSPRVINDSPFDDRDVGITHAGGKNVVMSWFTSDRRDDAGRKHLELMAHEDKLRTERWRQGLAWMDSCDKDVDRWCGSWVRTSADNGTTWGPAVRVPVTAPHGPIRLKNGALLYLGKRFGESTLKFRTGAGSITAITSHDLGQTWEKLGTVSICGGTTIEQYHEPHAVELAGGKLLGFIRFHVSSGFSMMQTESSDGGRTWSSPKLLGFHGSPPHVIRHSSGALVCVYSYRKAPFGERAMVSRDEGASWTYDYILRDDGPGSDLGYPSSVEMKDGSIFTVYYQQLAAGEKCSLLWTRWALPG